MNARDRVKLLFGPYKPPALRRGDRASCLYRDCDVKIIGWTDARIPWPLCRAIGARGGGHGPLVDDELVRAIRHESAAAIMHWWGVNVTTVWRWRQAFGVGRAGTPGSRRLIQAAAQQGAEKLRGVPLSAEQREQRRQSAIKNNLAQYIRPGYPGEWWRPDELALLGTAPDHELAERLGRSLLAVSLRRRRAGIANPWDRRRRECRG